MPSQTQPKSKMCKGKTYKSRASAERAAEEMGGKDYRCPYCPGFHVSKKPIGSL